MDGWMEVCFLAAFALLLLCSGCFCGRDDERWMILNFGAGTT